MFPNAPNPNISNVSIPRTSHLEAKAFNEGFPGTIPDSLLTTTLFLGDLSVLCNEISVRELFSRYGEIERVQLKKSDRDPQRAHLGFGFVKFATRASAERALEELNGKFFLGRALRVGWAEDHNRIGTGVKAADPKKNHQTAQLHVSFMSRDMNKRVSEMDLGGVFTGFGNVVDIAIKKNVLNRESGVQSGYAFVHFSLTLAGLESALTAAERVNNCIFDNITYKCKTDHALVMQYRALKASESSHAAPPLYPSVHDYFDFYEPKPRETLSIDHAEYVPRQTIQPIPYTLNFSTYGNTVEPQTVYSPHRVSHREAFFSPKHERRLEYRHNEAEIFDQASASASISRSSSSMREEDIRSPVFFPSVSSSVSYDDFPSYRRGTMKDSYDDHYTHHHYTPER